MASTMSPRLLVATLVPSARFEEMNFMMVERKIYKELHIANCREPPKQHRCHLDNEELLCDESYDPYGLGLQRLQGLLRFRLLLAYLVQIS